MNVSFLLLAGGKGSRMEYRDKSSLRYDRERDFLQKILCETRAFHEIIISKNTPLEKERLAHVDAFLGRERKYSLVEDTHGGCGPIAGLYAGLKESTNPYVFVAPCDMPNITQDFIEYILGYLSSDYDAVVVKDAKGKIHPLCGIYRTALLPTIYAQMEAGDFKVLNLLKNIRVKTIDFTHTNFDLGYILHNFNTMESLKELKTPKIFAISGVKNSGKTTLIEKMIGYLSQEGFKVAAIKHDGHDFTGDVPGTDTFKMREAGATGTLIYSETKFMLIEEKRYEVERYLSMFKDYDYIILEGFKGSHYPKFEIVRKGNSCESVAEKKNLLGIITDIEELECDEGVEKISLADGESIKKILRGLETYE